MMKRFNRMGKISFIVTLFFIISAFSPEQKSILAFSKTAGFRHNSIEKGVESIKKLAKENNFKVLATEDSDIFVSELKNHDIVIFLNTTGDILNEHQQNTIIKFIHSGGGFVGIHAAADTEYRWPWYGKMVGAYFLSHPKQQDAIINVVDHEHLATEFLGNQWKKFDEWYNYKDINSAIQVLLKLDEKSYEGGENGNNHPISWFHEFEGGRIFYSGMGHTEESYEDEKFLKHILGGIYYTMGKSIN
jgi:type 1 glutamine amidotransferase